MTMYIFLKDMIFNSNTTISILSISIEDLGEMTSLLQVVAVLPPMIRFFRVDYQVASNAIGDTLE